MVAFAQPVLAQQESTDIKKPATQVVEKIGKQFPKLEKPKFEPIVDRTVIKASASQQTEQSVAKTQSTPGASGVSCEQAIRQTWPSRLQEGAIIVSRHENRTQDPVAVGAVNDDGHQSRDYGCFQINDYWHPAYFTEGNWKDSVWAAKYALRIYEERQRQTGNGWEAWYAVQGILW